MSQFTYYTHQMNSPCIDESFIRTVLSVKYKTDNVIINNLRTNVDTSKGAHFASEICRFTVESSLGTHHLIMKRNHSNDNLVDMLKSFDLFQKEITYYQHYMPAFKIILQSAGELENLVPELYYCDAINEVIILQDLVFDGFKAGNFHTRIPSSAVPATLRKIAKLHAASMIFNRQRDEELATASALNEANIQRSPVKEQFAPNISAFAKEVESWGGDFKKISLKLERISEDYLELASVVRYSSRGLNALVHRDMWFSNILFRENPTTGTCDGLRIIDFQTVKWGSVAIDLIQFIFTSLNEQDYQDKFDQLVAIYHGHLERVLRKCSYSPIPDLQTVQLDVKEKLFHGMS